MMELPSGFGRQLAHVEKKTRDAAVSQLTSYLETRTIDNITQLEMSRLWKGLYYCFWMSDKPRVQQHLADRLASMVHVCQRDVAVLYITCFWSLIIKEWTGVDRLRIDKFYFLIRKMHFHTFGFLRTHSYPEDLITKLHQALPLEPNNQALSGLRYHTCEAYLQELKKSLQGNEILEDVLMKLVEPFWKLLKRDTAVGLTKVTEMVESIIQDAKLVASDAGSSEDEQPLPFNINTVITTLQTLLEDTDTLKKNKSTVKGLLEQCGVEFPEPERPVTKHDLKDLLKNKPKKQKKRKATELADEQVPELIKVDEVADVITKEEVEKVVANVSEQLVDNVTESGMEDAVQEPPVRKPKSKKQKKDKTPTEATSVDTSKDATPVDTPMNTDVPQPNESPDTTVDTPPPTDTIPTPAASNADSQSDTSVKRVTFASKNRVKRFDKRKPVSSVPLTEIAARVSGEGVKGVLRVTTTAQNAVNTFNATRNAKMNAKMSIGKKGGKKRRASAADFL